ncbi:hypothetical protein BH23ACT9_BH23ACT9_35920 [soil metagenome]
MLIPLAVPASASIVASEAAPGAVVRPVPGAVVRPFDPPEHPYGPGHRGVDLAAVEGEDVRAALDGTVVFSGTVATVGWITLDHGGGLTTTYGPMAARVPPGTAVTAGEVIGQLALTEHLDWGARLDGDYIDPMLLLRRWTIRLTATDAVRTGQPMAVP